MTRKIESLLQEYGESHQNPINKAIHWVCVPVIFWTITALIWSLPVPLNLQSIPDYNWLMPVLIGIVLYYLIASWQLAIGIIVFVGVCVLLINAYATNVDFPLWKFAFIMFVIAWIGQFWGHKIEGKKPSFFKDVQFLLIGPAWLLHFLYNRMGIRY